MRKNIVERGRPLTKILRMRIACWLPKATNTHTLWLCNTYRFSTATTVAEKRLNVTLYAQCLSCVMNRVLGTKLCL